MWGEGRDEGSGACPEVFAEHQGLLTAWSRATPSGCVDTCLGRRSSCMDLCSFRDVGLCGAS